MRPTPEAGKLSGIALAFVLAGIAYALGLALPLVGGAVIGILCGIALGAFLPRRETFAPGIAFSAKQLLQASVVMLGFGLDLQQVLRTGAQSLIVTLSTLTVAFLVAWRLGAALKIPGKLAALIGIGTAICGGAAIAATAPILEADEHDTAYSVSTIFLFNIVAVLLFPVLGHLLHMTQQGFGLWAGTAINDTSSVVAAGYHYGKLAGDEATIVKLTRAVLIVPICVVLAVWMARRKHAAGTGGFILRKSFPWFIAWFLVASAIRSTGLLSQALQDATHALAGFLIVVALTAVGLSANLPKMAATGSKPILLGLATWAAVAIGSVLVQALLMQL